MGRILTITYIWAKRCVIAVIGATVVLLGVAMIVLPGPALVVIPAGLAILGLEFAFARRWLRRLRATGTQVISYTSTRLRWFRRAARDERRAHDENVRNACAGASFACGQAAAAAKSKRYNRAP